MSTQRLTFLYPTLFRSTTATATAATARSRSSARRCRRRHHHHPNVAAFFGTSTASGFGPRVGKGIEPPKPLGDVQAAPSLESHMKKGPQAAGAVPPPNTASPPSAAANNKTIPLPPLPPAQTPEQQRKDAAKALDPAVDAVKETLSTPGVSLTAQKKRDEAAATAAAAVAGMAGGDPENNNNSSNGSGPNKKKRVAAGPMDAVLHMEPPPPPTPPPSPEKASAADAGAGQPTPQQQDDNNPRHLMTPPPYVHHFDSYSLVKQLEGGGYTQAQAITAMKAVRTLLAHNLDVAQGELISKGDVENETYLFRAACAELGTEVKNNRRIADEALRQQRTVLQHEVDNTSQALNQELLVLNDNVRGMFNDRKMAVREEQKKAEGTVRFLSHSFFLLRVLCFHSSFPHLKLTWPPKT